MGAFGCMPLLLLIDDEPAQKRLVSALAARAGWRTIYASELNTALATLGTRDGMQLDAVLVDHWNPQIKPVDTIRQIRERRPKLPILVLTSQNDVLDAVDAMRAGANDYLAKPIAPDRFLAALNAVLDRSEEHSGEVSSAIFISF
jgi:DNA-binding response OmpR family regulator